mmetsp:Transcript_6167/g.12281  ORF Transcript_6167/g.12281 Transcript_6167/m.12281 type:complete len:225 (+) Transcript_6167:22-696(+)|eukprot:CAMPEP_0119072930 /NCGR_PEP_ID=MMETSP1178-20130426/60957_1 /TAXON_ID=33656 /ORGANISM="unid sp, Strain CCMP2000" /LENGTH=224 /DNA_ID=CAMNT_0007054985 /DNA_START=22 /DNA_END=696 /DNA_ORIENTATION=-
MRESVLMAFFLALSSALLVPPMCKPSPARVLVKNIAFEADENAVRDKLATFGPVTRVSLAKASKRHHARPHQGWAWVYFDGEHYARRAAASGGSLSLHGRALSIRLIDVHGSSRSGRRSSSRGRRPAVEATQLNGVVAPTNSDSAEAEQQRSIVVDRLQSCADEGCSLLEVQSCVDELGELQSADEYQISKAAWKRAVVGHVNTPRQRTDDIDAGKYRRASSSI